MKKNLNNQKGFTLVEIAIVMVIIGLLIGGILKGQEMIKNAKVKRVTKQADEFRAAVISYQDRYAIYPGDDNDPNTHTGATDLTAGNANGQVAVAEAPDLFMHLAAANLISGSYTTAAASYPKNAFGGQAYMYYLAAQGKTCHWILFTLIPGDVGRMIDSSMDDGTYDTGSIRASEAYTNDNVVTLYNEF